MIAQERHTLKASESNRTRIGNEMLSRISLSFPFGSVFSSRQILKMLHWDFLVAYWVRAPNKISKLQDGKQDRFKYDFLEGIGGSDFSSCCSCHSSSKPYFILLVSIYFHLLYKSHDEYDGKFFRHIAFLIFFFFFFLKFD